jgi:enoyl-CoA hydratase/carnithine racemase
MPDVTLERDGSVAILIIDARAPWRTRCCTGANRLWTARPSSSASSTGWSPATGCTTRPRPWWRDRLQRPPLTFRRYKATVSRTRELPVPAALRTDVRPDPNGSEDLGEGVAAFLEERPPRWQRR